MKINKKTSDFKKHLEEYRYQGIDNNGGDSIEKKHGDKVIDLFRNSEIFWRLFIVPMTNRIDDNYNGNDPIGLRKILFDKGTDLIDISRLNYSVLFNLISAYKCIEEKNKEEKRISFFENFYAHLGTICDLAEELIKQVYFLIQICQGNKIEYFRKFTYNEFIDFAKRWYINNYESSHEKYLSQGKVDRNYLPINGDPFEKYFGKAKEKRCFLTFSGSIRQYRNSIIHNPKIPGHFIAGNIYVPKKEKIKNYMKWHQVHAIDPIVNENIIKSDFIEQFELMEGDFKTMKVRLNDLWEKPIKDLEQLLYVEQNSLLIEKYSLQFEK